MELDFADLEHLPFNVLYQISINLPGNMMRQLSERIEDISPLLNLINLEELNIGRCRNITNVLVLTQLTNLKKLSVQDYKIKGLPPHPMEVQLESIIFPTEWQVIR